MKVLVRALAIGSLSAIAASPLTAQDVTGRWIAEFDRAVRSENGGVSTGDKAKARLVLQQRGDSVSGTLQLVDPPTGPDGRAPTVRHLRGTISGNKLSLSTEGEVRRNMNGEESVHKVTIVYDLTVNGDKLDGTTSARASEMRMPPRPFSATREKS